nr:PREDICTED: kanadaptin-like [Latimeria chalumnae]|eukprot:XP_014340004.1 PREDICTED: kanadaptin-like [Latimeria chalumnae]
MKDDEPEIEEETEEEEKEPEEEEEEEEDTEKEEEETEKEEEDSEKDTEMDEEEEDDEDNEDNMEYSLSETYELADPARAQEVDGSKAPSPRAQLTMIEEEECQSLLSTDSPVAVSKNVTVRPEEAAAGQTKKACETSRPPWECVSAQYPKDDPNYCMWVPPTGQSGDGRTRLNDKYGY